MATKVKEDALIKEKSISAPSTPRRGDIRHSKRPTIESLVRDPSMPEEKPIPNYLRPTISSCHHNNCHYPKKSTSQPLEVSLTAGKSLPPRKPIDDKSPSPLSTALRTSCGDRAKVSSDDGFENSPKKTLMRARSLPRFITKKRDINADISAKKSNGSETQDHTPKKDVESSKQKLPEIKSPPKRKDSKNNKHYAGFGEEHKNEHSESPKSAKTHRAKAASNNGNGGRLKAMVEGDRKPEQERTAMLKRQDVGGKETLPMYNEVIEETASKLAAKRSKVKALVGAFETVISLQEPEGQSGQPYDDDEIKVQRGEEIEKTSKDSRQQLAETKNIKKKTKNDRVDQKGRQERERESKDGRLEQHKHEEENTKGCEIGQESQQEEQEVSKVNPHGQLIVEQDEANAAELGQESQQDMEISKGGQNGQNSQPEEVKEVNEEKRGRVMKRRER
uniref:Calmodulin-binding domain-containing protein n=1 Tax=Ananas comosus var. bracteatus TaxID=296719 RepID=A0A6V7PMD0_ANACO|nr:unnamed protein product [Ananas comosus var. bracteatus]